jgi:Amt family ammonium transporter
MEQFGAQCLGLAVNFGWAFGLSWLMFVIIKKTIGIRVSKEEESKGLNIVEFNDIYSWESYMEISSYESQLNEKNRLLMKQSKILSKTEATERENLARSLHDGLGQSLAALKLLLKMNDSELSRQALDLTETSIAEMRNVLNDLRPAWLDEGLPKALAYMTESLDKLDNFSCKLVVEGELPLFDEAVTLNIYRLIQEALTNVVKHSEATESTVTCRAKDELCYFRIKDNGVGFEPDDASYGIGIDSMRDRAKMIGGDLRITTKLGSGTTVEIEVPYGEN